MDGERSVPKAAVVSFGSAREAGRRVAGVAAVARIVRELAEAGVGEAWLALPPGDALGAAAMADVRRLAGKMRVEAVSGDSPASLPDRAGDDILFLTGSRLIPAEAIPDLHNGHAATVTAAAIRLDGPNAAAEILRATGKSGDGPVSRWLNRPVSRRLSELLLRVPGLRPGHATAGTAILAAFMFVALIWGGAKGLIVGGLLFQAASVFDGVDGELARATFRSSPAGAVLDSAVDVATNLLLIVGLTYNLASRGVEAALPLAAWGFVLFVLGLIAIAWRASRADGPFSLDMVKHHYRHRFSGRFASWLMEFFTIVTSRDFFAFLFAVLIVVGFPMGCLYLFAAAATIWILFVVGSFGMAPNPTLASRSA